MDRTTTIGGNTPLAGDTNPLSNPAINAKIEGAAKTAHQAVDKVADKATVQVDQLSGSAHRAVDSAADAATSASDWASGISEQAKRAQTQLTEATRESIRMHPLCAVGSALAIGYLLGRLARL